VRELREFRVLHPEFTACGAAVACASRDPVDRAREWARRLELPYPLLCDVDGALVRPLGILTRLSIAGWSIELMKRTTLLVAADGTVARVWPNVLIPRGHARAVLDATRALRG